MRSTTLFQSVVLLVGLACIDLFFVPWFWRWGQLQINETDETGAEHCTTRHEKRTNMGPKGTPKQMQNRSGAAEAFGERFGRSRRLHTIMRRVVWGPVLGSNFHKNRRIQSEKVSTNQCKTPSKFEAQRGPKNDAKMYQKNKDFSNGHLLVVLRKSSFYDIEAMVFQRFMVPEIEGNHRRERPETRSEKGVGN